MNRILTICPTRERVDKCFEMLKSFFDTSSESDIFVVVDNDDPESEKYLDMFSDKRWHDDPRFDYVFLPRMTTTRIFNGALKNFPDYEFYQLANDDYFYVTEEWDKKCLEILDKKGFGIACMNDTIHKHPIPSTAVISGKIVRAVGWLQLPTLTYLSGDLVWKVIAEKLNCFYYLPDVLVEHRHFLKDESYRDKISDNTNSKKMYEKDNEFFKDWLANQCFDDVKKIKDALDI